MTNPKDMEDRPTGRGDMVERAARALVKCDGYEWDYCITVRYLEEARAAIEAMREPTWGMVSASEIEITKDDYGATWIEDVDVRDGWQRMIDAALGLAQRPSGDSK